MAAQVGRTPAMGYNTWNDFRCNGITAENVMKVADKMVAMNMASFGYEVTWGCRLGCWVQVASATHNSPF